ncbi:hypothetical protein NP493_220g01038 [Ridgeia piscesae]|uniref:Uncharacterized protein n=1 Tax=Ridgeia piscesae TaxID=27915 RepID=A0AAD9UDX8_RIDPI|nr:hypothetical protein NP493_220g01038 [Ridgeia piscesae]
MVKEQSDDKAASSVEYELDGVILVPAERGRYGDSSPASVVVVESDNSDEGELPCSNKTTGFEPMQGKQLMTRTCAWKAKPKSEVQLPTMHLWLDHRKQLMTRTCAWKAKPRVVQSIRKCLWKSGRNLQKAEKEDGCEQITDDEDVPGTDEVCSLRSSRKTFSLNSSPLLKSARESLELHNVLSEAAQMMPDTEGSMDPGSMDPDLLDRHPKSFSPSLCAERENSQYTSTGRASSTCKTKQKLSLKQHCSPYHADITEIVTGQ